MALPIGPRSPPSSATRRKRVSISYSSPAQQVEVDINNEPEAYYRTPSSTSKSNRGPSPEKENREPSPVLPAQKSGNSYQRKHARSLTQGDFAPVSPITPENTKADESLWRRYSTGTPVATKKSAPSNKGSPSPKLLTEVSEEDFLRRSHLHNRVLQRGLSHTESGVSRHVSTLSQIIEEPFPSPGRPVSQSKDYQDINSPSLFDLTPLAIKINKTPPSNQSSLEITKANLEAERELELLLQIPEISDDSKELPSNSLYKPSLFSTQHGFNPVSAFQRPHRKPVGSPPRVKFAITSPTPEHSLEDSSNLDRRHSIHDTPTKSAPSGTTIYPPISAKYITALENTASANQAARLAKKFRRQTSLARIRELTPSTSSGGLYSTSTSGTPNQPLTLWISDLCHANKMPPPPSAAPNMGPQTQSHGNKLATTNRTRLDDLDDAYAADAESGTRKVKPTPSEELTVMIDDMLNDLTGKFHAVTSEIMAKMDDMGRRIDNLEASLNHDAEKADEETNGAQGTSDRRR